MYKSHGILTELWVFIKRHIVICVLCLICGLAVAKYSNLPIPSWLPNFIQVLLLRPQDNTTALECWEILNNLSLAFIASIITFIVIQYIPERIKAYKAFLLMKKEFIKLYSAMSRLIDMYLFEINVKETEKKIKAKQLSIICEIILSNETRNCKITSLNNGKRGNTVTYGYALYKNSKEYADSVHKVLENIKQSMFVTYLDPQIIEILSTVENNWFLKCFLELKAPQTKTPGYKHLIANFDKGFYEFIKCHIALNKYHFDKYSYDFKYISSEEMAAEKEKLLFMTTRAFLKPLGKETVKRIADQIVSFKPTEERIRKSEGVLLEILVYYDSEKKKDYEVLHEALRIAEYIRKNEVDQESKLYALLNTMQIKKRLHVLSNDDIIILQNIISDKNMSNEVIIGASILCGEFVKATIAFEKLSEEKKKIMIQFPIYRLWINPPIEANLEPTLFITY